MSSWKGVLGVPFWTGLGPTKRPGLTNYKLEKGGSQSPQQQNFSSPKNKTYQKRCGYELLMSSSSSQVESAVLRSQITFTRLVALPFHSLTWRSSIATGCTTTRRSFLTCTSSASSTCDGSNTYFLSWETWKIRWRLANWVAIQSHKLQALSFSRSDMDPRT